MNEIITIAAVICGWGLNELTRYFRKLSEHKEAIASALSILLETRFQALMMEHIINDLKNRGESSEIIPVVRQFIDQFMPNTDLSDDEYNESIRIIAKSAPLLAYEYRSRNSFPHFIKNWRSFATQEGMPLTEIEELESKLQSMIIPSLNDLILYLARSHSRKSFKSVKQILHTKIEMPEDVKTFMGSSIPSS